MPRMTVTAIPRILLTLTCCGILPTNTVAKPPVPHYSWRRLPCVLATVGCMATTIMQVAV